jgi:hypothetical protein
MNSNQATIQPVECCGIRCTDTGLFEMEGSKVMVSVQKSEIQRITLRHGIQAPNPTLQIIFGLAVASVGYFPIRELILWLQHGGTIFSTYHFLIIVSAIGIWTVFEAVKRGYFLEVQTTAGTKRLAFAKRPDEETLRGLMEFIERNYDKPILREDGIVQRLPM